MGDVMPRAGRTRARGRSMRRPVAAAVCASAMVAAVAACGGGGGKGEGASHLSATAKAARTAAPATPGAARVLTEPQLEKAAVGRADLPGWSATMPYGRQTTPRDVSALPRVSPAACAPLAGIARGPLSTTRQHRAVLTLQLDQDGKDGAVVDDTLLAYQPADARGVLTDVRASLRTCTSFPDGDGDRYTDPVPQAAPSVGDDAVAFGLTQVVPSVDDKGDDDGGAPVDAPFRFLVVRSGATVVVLSAQGFPGDHPVIPAQIAKAQLAKLAKVG